MLVESCNVCPLVSVSLHVAQLSTEACVRISFIKLNDIALHVYTKFWLSIHQAMDFWVASTFWVLSIMLWTWVCKYLSKSLLWLLLRSYSEAELLGYVLTLCLIFLQNSFYAFPQWLHHFRFPPAVHGKFWFPHILTNTCDFWFRLFAVAILVSSGVSSWFDARFSSGQWRWASFPCLLVICASSLEKCLFKYFGNFLNGIILFSFLIAFTLGE